MTSMLDGLSILITGGASGIGAAAAHIFSGYGASVAVADIDRDAAEATAEAIRGKGGSAIAIAADVRSEEHPSELQSLMRISYAVLCLKKKKNSKGTTKINKHFID